MRKLLRRIFGRPEDATKIIEGSIKGLDALVFTEEEKSRANAKISDWYLKYLQATEGQNLARRFIAMLVVGLWVVLIIVGVMVRLVDAIIRTIYEVAENVQQPLIEASDFIFAVLVDVVMTPFSIIIGFYFLTHAVRTYQKEKNGG